MQPSLAFLLILLSVAHAAISANSTESIKHRRVVTYFTTSTTIPAAGLLINLRSFENNEVVKVTSNQKLAMTSNEARIATFKLTRVGTKLALQEYTSGLYVSAEAAGKKSLRAVRSHARSWELFSAVSVGGTNNVFALASETNGNIVTVTPYKTLTAKTPSTALSAGVLVRFQLVIVTPPQVLDSQATALIGVVGGTNVVGVDDAIYNVSAPFPVTLYGKTNSNLAVSCNGYISLALINGPVPDSRYSPRALPSQETSYPQAAIFIPLWQDLFYYSNTAQGLFYQTKGSAPDRVFNIEYYASQFNDPTQYYHFLVTFYENRPGVVRFTYYTILDSGLRGSVGAQCYGCTNSPFTQYSFKTTRITDGLVIEYNPNTNTFVSVSP